MLLLHNVVSINRRKLAKGAIEITEFPREIEILIKSLEIKAMTETGRSRRLRDLLELAIEKLAGAGSHNTAKEILETLNWIDSLTSEELCRPQRLREIVETDPEILIQRAREALKNGTLQEDV